MEVLNGGIPQTNNINVAPVFIASYYTQITTPSKSML